MKLPAVLASDLHLTANPLDEYRWGLFPWLERELVAERAETLVLLGDITDSKDYHPAQLVNRLVRAVASVSRVVPRTVILRGNHDYLKDGHTFFEFLSALPGVEVVTRPTEDLSDGAAAMFLPHTRTPASDWRGMDFSHYDYLFMHQTVRGAVAGNGQRMGGEELPPLDAGRVWSGDIHVPQRVGPVEYVGSPYHVHFGDDFRSRCVVIERGGRTSDIRFPSPRRVSVRVSDADGVRAARLSPGDQVKARVRLAESEKHAWRRVRDEVAAAVAERGAALCGLELEVERERRRVRAGERHGALTPEEALARFVGADALGGELLDAGLEILEAL